MMSAVAFLHALGLPVAPAFSLSTLTKWLTVSQQGSDGRSSGDG